MTETTHHPNRLVSDGIIRSKKTCRLLDTCWQNY